MVAAFDAATTGARIICFGCCFGALLGCERRSSLPIAFSPSGDSPRPFCAARPRPCALTLDPMTLSFICGGPALCVRPLLTRFPVRRPPLRRFPSRRGSCSLRSRSPRHATLSPCALRFAPRTPRRPPTVELPSVECRGCKLHSRVGASDFCTIVELCTAAFAI